MCLDSRAGRLLLSVLVPVRGLLLPSVFWRVVFYPVTANKNLVGLTVLTEQDVYGLLR